METMHLQRKSYIQYFIFFAFRVIYRPQTHTHTRRLARVRTGRQYFPVSFAFINVGIDLREICTAVDVSFFLCP